MTKATVTGDIVQLLRDRAYSFKAPDRLSEKAADEIERLRLTDSEREAIREACDEGRWYPKDYHYICTLRGLLERTK